MQPPFPFLQDRNLHQQKTLPAQVLVMVATYNERENLVPLVRSVRRVSPEFDLLIIDDNSPDGTGRIADGLAREDSKLHVLHRARKEGLAVALVAGFKWGLGRNYDFLLNMDADLSHSPEDIPRMLSATCGTGEDAQGADLAIGSRYLNGIRVIDWQPHRLFLSLCAARYVHTVTGLPVCDPTSGFRCYRRDALEQILCDTLLSTGYCSHIEMAHRIWRSGRRVIEVPITYTDRKSGETKLSNGIIAEAIWITFRLLLQSRFRRHPAEMRENSRR